MALPAMPSKRLRHSTRRVKGCGLYDSAAGCSGADLSRAGRRNGERSEVGGMLCEESLKQVAHHNISVLGVFGTHET
jgi:hypothetical protein